MYYNAKTNSINERPRAIYKEDIELLSSNSPDDLKRWVVWTNPNTGKKYTVINKKDNIDGTKTVRILDSTGKLVKEITVKPKNFVMISPIGRSKDTKLASEWYLEPEYLAELAFVRNNPIANFELQNTTHFFERKTKWKNNYNTDNVKMLSAIGNIINRVTKDKEKIDLLLFDSHDTVYKTYDKFREFDKIIEQFSKGNMKEEEFSDGILDIIHIDQKLVSKDIDKLSQLAITDTASPDELEYIVSSALEWLVDKGKTHVVHYLNNNDILDDKPTEYANIMHPIKDYKHKITATKDGVNLTEKLGADLTYKGSIYEAFAGKKAEDLLVSPEDTKEYIQLRDAYENEKIDEEEYYNKIEKFEGKIFRYSDLYPYDKTKSNIPNLYTTLFSCLDLVIDSDGCLIPYIENKFYNAGQISMIEKYSNELLNEAMFEILK